MKESKSGSSGLAQRIREDFARLAAQNGEEKKRVLQSFFKTGKGEYGEGDLFYGVTVPQTRALAKQYRNELEQDKGAVLEGLMCDPYHDCRLLALLFLVQRMEKADDAQAEAIYRFYMAHAAYINNWDLVDLSAPQVVGEFLLRRKDWKILKEYAQRPHLWTQRIAIIATFAFIKAGDTRPVYAIGDLLLQHPHDLIQKATGWMLREAGKRVSQDEEIRYLTSRRKASEPVRYRIMPRTMLRYAIERFDSAKRAEFMRA
ncbi:MAG: DNA alkylation repair protein [Bacteroidales bacterium]|nr:DNA alkylation repair protein [Bacteroidales bacterium]